MSSIRKLFIRRLKQQKLDKVVLGTMVIKKINTIMWRDDIDGHVKNNVIFIKTYDQSLRIDIHQKQLEILSTLNDYLKQQDFNETIKSIRLL